MHEQPKCVSCVFWEMLPTALDRATGSLRLGKCRRRSPIAAVWPDGKPRTIYPITREEEFCGQHREPASNVPQTDESRL